MNRKQALLAAVLFCIVIFGAGYKAGQHREKNVPRPVVMVNREEGGQTKNKTVTVHVTGAVRKPGVYTFREGARINEAVYAAGALKNADLTVINLAEVMTDQQQVYVPRCGELEGAGMAPGRTGTGAAVTAKGGRMNRSGKININTADSTALDALPGIGPALARRIVDFRQEHGKFKNPADLLNVPGIGEKKLAEIKDRITV